MRKNFPLFQKSNHHQREPTEDSMKLIASLLLKPFLPFSTQHIPLYEYPPPTAPPSNFNRHTLSLEINETEIWISPTQQETENRFEIEPSSYFESLVYNQHEVTNSNTIPLKAIHNPRSFPQFHIYDHPEWKDWNAIWKQEPLVLDPDLFPPPVLEKRCHSAQFQIRPIFSHAVFGIPLICQGTTFVFKRFVDPYVRYIVEWCQWTDNQHAYLKVVGIRISGNPYPYNDPRHPTFILHVPLNIACTLFPPLLLEQLHGKSPKKNSKNTTSLLHQWKSSFVKTIFSSNRTVKNAHDHLGE